jgi:tetratricopeptide (TPR) repeat protein
LTVGLFGGENADSYFDEGVTASMRGDLPRAIEFFEKCIRQDSSYSAAYHQLGRVYHRMGQFQRAATFISQVVNAKPGQIPPRVDLGYALLGMGQPGKAQEHFAKVAADKPGNARALLGLALCAYHQQNLDAASLLVQDAVNALGATYGAFYLMARIGRDTGREDWVLEGRGRAEKLVEKLIEGSPDQPEGYYLRGLLADVMGDAAKAEEDFAKAIETAEPGRHYAAYEEHFSLEDMLGRLAATQARRNPGAAEATFARLREAFPESSYLPRS